MVLVKTLGACPGYGTGVPVLPDQQFLGVPQASIYVALKLLGLFHPGHSGCCATAVDITVISSVIKTAFVFINFSLLFVNVLV